MTKKSQLADNQGEKITTPADIISDIIKYSGLTGQKFAQKIGMSQSVVSEYQQNRYQKMSKKMENAILTAFPELSRVWLLTGEGNMLQNVNVEGHGNGNGNTVTVGIDGDKLLAILQAREDDVRSRNSQIDRLLSIIERMQGV